MTGTIDMTDAMKELEKIAEHAGGSLHAVVADELDAWIARYGPFMEAVEEYFAEMNKNKEFGGALWGFHYGGCEFFEALHLYRAMKGGKT